MNDEQVKELIDRGNRTAILLGEITGRLMCLVEIATINDDDVPPGAMEDLLFTMVDRIEEIYYNKNKKEDTNE